MPPARPPAGGPPQRGPHQATLERLDRSIGGLATATLQRMEEALPWYRSMPPAERSWIGLIAQSGIAAFVDWFRAPDAAEPTITAEVFGSAPRELARSISLQQTVELIRVSIEVVEERVDELAAPGEAAALREAVLRYSREVAFATAQVYAGAAEARGAWDARLEALVVDALLRGEVDEVIRSRAAALGWGVRGRVAVAVGEPRDVAPDVLADAVQRIARSARIDVISAVQGDRLVLALAGVTDAVPAATALVGQFGPGPVVVGPVVADLADAPTSARAAIAGLHAAPAWPAAPRPVAADDLLPERALDADPVARAQLVETGFLPLQQAGGDLLVTLSAYLDESGSIEGAARRLFVHPNTVRYRLRRVAQVTGFVPTEPRGGFGLRLALAYGRLRSL